VITGRLLARNTAINFAGLMIPLGVAVVAVPVLLKALGPDRFGILALAWALVGYFALMDFGLGRALTQAASQALGAGEEERLRQLSVVSLATMFILGIVGGAVTAGLTPWLAYSVLEMDPTLRPEAATSFYLLAASLPFVLTTIGFRGLLEAHQHFGLATALRLPYAIFNFVGPLLVLPWSRSLVPIVAMLVLGRLVMFAAHLIACLRRYPWLIRGIRLTDVGTLRPLLRDGGWMMVSNVISPLMVYLDRFVIGGLISMAAVTFYVTPFELTSKLLFLPAAVLGVFFPAFAATYAQNPTRTAVMVDRANRLVLIGVFPAVLFFVAFAREILLFWVGPEQLAPNSATIMQLLTVGMLINSMAQVPVAFLQATRRADLTARVHLIELPVYAAMIIVFGRTLGITGVALAWTLRVSIDTLTLSWLSRRQLAELVPGIDRILVWLAVTTTALLVTMLPTALMPRILIAVAFLVSFLAAAWKIMLSENERSFAVTALRRPSQPVHLETTGSGD
jgi:O-antigen/teichoic acid export membrane protein